MQLRAYPRAHPPDNTSSHSLTLRPSLIIYIAATFLFLTGFVSVILIFAIQGSERDAKIPYISDAFDRGASRVVFRVFVTLTAFMGVLAGIVVCLVHLFEARSVKTGRRRGTGREVDIHGDGDVENGLGGERDGHEEVKQEQNGNTDSGRVSDVESADGGDETNREERSIEIGRKSRRISGYYTRLILASVCLALMFGATILFSLVAAFRPSEGAHALALGVALLCLAIWGILLMIIPLSRRCKRWIPWIAWISWAFMVIGAIIMGVGMLGVDSRSLAAAGEYIILLAATGFLVCQGLRFSDYRIVVGI